MDPPGEFAVREGLHLYVDGLGSNLGSCPELCVSYARLAPETDVADKADVLARAALSPYCGVSILTVLAMRLPDLRTLRNELTSLGIEATKSVHPGVLYGGIALLIAARNAFGEDSLADRIQDGFARGVRVGKRDASHTYLIAMEALIEGSVHSSRLVDLALSGPLHGVAEMGSILCAIGSKESVARLRRAAEKTGPAASEARAVIAAGLGGAGAARPAWRVRRIEHYRQQLKGRQR